MARVSVIMSVYKEPIAWIEESVNSILAQTFNDYEFIIVCDNPEDLQIRSYLNSLPAIDSRIRIINNSHNIGLTKSLNKAISLISSPEYIARMDADDIAMPNRLYEQVKKLEGKSLSVCHTGKIIINSKGAEIRKDISSRPLDYSQLFLGNMIAHPSVMMTSDVLGLRKKLYNEDIKRGQDYELWSFFFLNNVEFLYIPLPLIKYRISDEQISRKYVTEQWRNSQLIRTKFVMDFLSREGIGVDIKETKKARAQIRHKILSEKECANTASIKKILFLLDYNLVAHNTFSFYTYLFDYGLFKDIDSIYKKMFLQTATKKRIYPFWLLESNE